MTKRRDPICFLALISTLASPEALLAQQKSFFTSSVCSETICTATSYKTPSLKVYCLPNEHGMCPPDKECVNNALLGKEGEIQNDQLDNLLADYSEDFKRLFTEVVHKIKSGESDEKILQVAGNNKIHLAATQMALHLASQIKKDPKDRKYSPPVMFGANLGEKERLLLNAEYEAHIQKAIEANEFAERGAVDKIYWRSTDTVVGVTFGVSFGMFIRT